MQLIKADSDHLEVIDDLACQIWPVAYKDILSSEQLQYMLNKFYAKEALSEQMKHNHVFYLAQNEEGKYVGFVSYEINCSPDRTKIHKIYVLPETQGTGVGKLLFEKVRELALEANQQAIYLNVNKYNKAKDFYTKLGFKIVKDEVIDIGLGYVMDDYVMEVTF
ncbi:GNAT family N-acetyltransferase [Flavobacterium sp. NRK F10]|uniref:GNAT family N-acetyltransferase n=1 Tax=Flavobacterium sediminis TaxID=2201181 RepID=A0A2U8QVZ9_9FLAO|nr:MULTISPECIES: GNAT family N-acetyltransferase [Flavobacterium]AWM14303.1 GNAT family N-acetyltransferase [Flavobacterium sediminis]MCO6175521.1 GNAT family N-acetyltransferase [Flavobacterium sp. NRK F10]